MCRVLASSQLVKKFSAFYGNWNFLKAFKGAYLPPVPILNQISAVHASWRLIWMLCFHLSLGLPSGLFLSGLPNKTSYASFPHSCYMPRLSEFYWSDHASNIWWRTQIMKLFVMQLLDSPRALPNWGSSTSSVSYSQLSWACSFLIVSYKIQCRYKTRDNVFQYGG